MHNIPLQLSMGVKTHDRGSEEGKRTEKVMVGQRGSRERNEKDKTMGEKWRRNFEAVLF